MVLSTLTSASIVGLGFNLIQVLNVFDLVEVNWGEPFLTILNAVQFIAFDLDLVNFQCVVGSAPLAKYVAALCMFPVVTLLYALVCGCLYFYFKKKVPKHAG